MGLKTGVGIAPTEGVPLVKALVEGDMDGEGVTVIAAIKAREKTVSRSALQTSTNVPALWIQTIAAQSTVATLRNVLIFLMCNLRLQLSVDVCFAAVTMAT